jgi:hypothetical protein
MVEQFDIYCDTFTIQVSPWGAHLTLSLSEAHPAPNTIVQAATLGTIRMSNEHLKAMAFVLVKQLMRQEADGGIRYDLPTELLSQMGITREEWDSFWNHTGG